MHDRVADDCMTACFMLHEQKAANNGTALLPATNGTFNFQSPGGTPYLARILLRNAFFSALSLSRAAPTDAR